MGSALRILGLALVLLLAVIAVRGATLRSQQVAAEVAPAGEMDEEALAARLAGGLRFATVSHQDGAGRDDAAFEGFHRYLEAQYPLAHDALLRERVGDYSLLYTWAGSDPALRPVVLVAHQDVVPVEPGTETDWEHPPFSGAIAGGFVWGRGALDDKLNVLGQLEAAEALLREGLRPRRTIFFAFGHDEELGGDAGAARIASLLGERGARPILVLDEGGSILEGVIPGVTAPVAAVGIAEKGYVSLELEATAPGGHSSTPAAETSIGLLAAAVGRLERTPLRARLDGASRLLLESVGPEASFGHRMIYGNLWLFAPLVERALASRPATAAMIRTTTAVTVFQAGIKDNVIPSRARAVVNFRILPGDSIESVLSHARSVVAEPRIEIRALPKRREPCPPSRTDGEGWELLARSIREARPGTVVAPYLMLAGADARHFRGLSDSVYRFMPLVVDLDDTRRIHGTNERVRVAGYAELVRTYRRLLENAAR